MSGELLKRTMIMCPEIKYFKGEFRNYHYSGIMQLHTTIFKAISQFPSRNPVGSTCSSMDPPCHDMFTYSPPKFFWCLGAHFLWSALCGDEKQLVSILCTLTLHLLKATVTPSHTHTPHPGFYLPGLESLPS